MDRMSATGRFHTALVAITATLAIAAIAILYSWGSEHVPYLNKAFAPGPLSAKHQFLSGKCETCHVPTQGVLGSACIACHTNAAASLGKQSTAFHFAARECRGCHAEHLAARPSRMNHALLLRTETWRTSPPTSSSERVREITEDFQKLLGLSHSRTREAAMLNCAACHSNRDRHRGLFGQNCSDCHGSANWRVVGYVHPAASSKDCAQCHQAPPSHYMEHFAMVSKMIAGQEHAKVNECFLCHRTDSFNDIPGIGWYKHH